MELKGKKIAFLGDSITEGSGVSDIANCRYDNRLKLMAELDRVYNYGIGGTRISYRSVPSAHPVHDLYFCGRAFRMEKDVDVVVVFGGTNDFHHGSGILGSPNDKSLESFYGALDYLMSFLKAEYPGKTIVFMTPAHREIEDGSDAATVHTCCHSLQDYVDAVVLKGEEHGIPVLNLFENLHINPANADDKAKYAPDGLHFNDVGHGFIAECLHDFLKSL